MRWRLQRLGTCVVLLAAGCGPGTPNSSTPTGEISALEGEQIVAFCSKCHQPPDPDTFPQDRWAHEVFRGFAFYKESKLQDATPPPTQRTVKYYTDRAPQELPKPEPIPFVADESPRFQLAARWSVKPVPSPAVSYLSWKRWTDEGPEQLVMTDMLAGVVLAWDAADPQKYRLLANVSNPDSLEWCDLDRDGRQDLIVGNLGSFAPKDHSNGSVVWLRQEEGGRFAPTTLGGHFGRVSDVRAADLFGRGRLDLVVAEFGWQTTGSITLLEPSFDDAGKIQVERRLLDRRHGTIRVPPVDLDGDGKLDFVALISQEHESVEVFLNRGDGRFDAKPICSPREPAFGSSGLEAVDLDGDGDIDFLVSNGDMFDSFYVKAYHGLRWLENRGGLQFVEHQILNMPGVHGAAAADFDLDGDLDIVTAACFPARLFNSLPEADRKALTSAVWLEQIEPGQFVPHALEFGNAFHACHTVADIDGDGDTDVVLGQMSAEEANAQPPFVIYENLTRSVDRTHE